MADIEPCGDTAPHLAHVWTTLLARLVCVGVGLRLVTADNETGPATAQTAGKDPSNKAEGEKQ